MRIASSTRGWLRFAVRSYASSFPIDLRLCNWSAQGHDIVSPDNLFCKCSLNVIVLEITQIHITMIRCGLVRPASQP